MGKNKLSKFSDLESYPHVFQISSETLRQGTPFALKGNWSSFFKNNNPIVLELGCGKGEYTVEMAKLFPGKNFIGIDIKGARIWTGAKESYLNKMDNVAFLRTNIEMIHYCFGTYEISEIWLTFPDPQMKKTSKRLTSTNFLRIYRQILVPNGIIHLKTDSNFLFIYTKALIGLNNYPVSVLTNNLYNSTLVNDLLSIKTYYEQQWLGRGIDIKYIAFSLSQNPSFKEPEIEIEHDSYRSFGRSKRQHLEKTTN